MRVARLLVAGLPGRWVLRAQCRLWACRARRRSIRPQQACGGRLEFVSGLEAVFGRRKTHAQALTFRSQVTARGFVNANIIEGCDGFRVVVRGIDTFDVGVDLQSEARREGFAVTLECIQAKPLGRLEAIFGHGRDRPTATAIVNRADAAGFSGRQAAQRSVRRVRGVPRRLRGSARSRSVRRSGECARLQRRARTQLAQRLYPERKAVRTGDTAPRTTLCPKLTGELPCGQAARCPCRQRTPQTP